MDQKFEENLRFGKREGVNAFYFSLDKLILFLFSFFFVAPKSLDLKKLLQSFNWHTHGFEKLINVFLKMKI
jgi:hypothetical protein